MTAQRENAQMRLARMQAYDEPFVSAHMAVAGLDEVGRGPLAGPVLVAALLLPKQSAVVGVNDSKKLSEKKRESLAVVLCDEAIAVGYGCVDSEEIDRIGIAPATRLAAEEALRELHGQADFLLADSMPGFLPAIPYFSTAHGDVLSYRIAAASIVAKVKRDAMMRQYDEIYPGYQFSQHKGYGTAAHMEAIHRLGVSPIHRLCFLKNIIGETEVDKKQQERRQTGALSRESGKAAELLTVDFLEKLGYTVLDRNVYAAGGEIDILAKDGETLVFVEVKLRSGGSIVRAEEAIDAKKMQRMRSAAEEILSQIGFDGPCRFDAVLIDGDTGEIRHLQDVSASF